MSGNAVWFAAMDFNNPDRCSELMDLDKYVLDNRDQPEKATRFYPGDPITVTLRGVKVLENEDAFPLKSIKPGDKNDLFISTTYQFGKEPLVDKLHMMQKDVDLGWQDDFVNRIILAMRDFKDLDEALSLQIRVYDTDKVNREFVDLAKNLANNAVAAIPMLYPYAVPIKLATGTFDAFTNLAENLDTHDKIIDEKLVLEATEPMTGHPLLQQGYYVVFRKDVTQDQARYLKLLSDRLAVLDANKKELDCCSYAVIEIHKNYRLSPEVEIDEKAAKLAAELNKKGQSGKSALEFLRDTMKTYGNFRKLERIKELEAKADLSTSEKKLLEDLKKDPEIKDFIK